MKSVYHGQFLELDHAPEGFCRTLCEAGYTVDVAWRKAESLRRAVRAAKQAGLTAALKHGVAIFVPGRIELWGKHTDYAGGDSITCATDQGFCALLVPDSDDWSSPLSDSEAVLRLHRLDTEEECTLPLVRDSIPSIDSRIEQQPWIRYPWTVIRRLVKNFGDSSENGRPGGGTLFFESDLPLAAGMSSSSAFMILVALTLIERNQWWQSTVFTQNIPDTFALANYLASVENGSDFGTLAGDRGVGTSGGSEDHTAILLSKRGFLRRYRYAPVRLVEEVAWPIGYRLVVGVSGVVAEKSGAVREQYNAAARLASELAVWWRRLTGRMEDHHLGAAFESRSTVMQILSEGLREQPSIILNESNRRRLLRRLEHFEVENIQLIPAAMAAFRAISPRSEMANDSRVDAIWNDLGVVCDRVDSDTFEKRLRVIAVRSQLAAEELLENQTPETSFLAACALRDVATERPDGLPVLDTLDAMLPIRRAQEQAVKDIEHRVETRAECGEVHTKRSENEVSGPRGREESAAFAVASSAFGAGFGGSVWAIVPEAAVAAFSERWLSDYRRQFPRYADAATVLVTDAAPAAMIFTQISTQSR